MFRVNKEKCIGCRACIANCPGATKIGKDGKAEIINQEKLKECGGESICPLGAIEKFSKEEKLELSPGLAPSESQSSNRRRLNRRRGPGWLRGMGRRWRGGRS